jgi:hypothetical protein
MRKGRLLFVATVIANMPEKRRTPSINPQNSGSSG